MTTAKIADQAITAGKLAPGVAAYDTVLSIPGSDWITTTTSLDINFGTITLPVTSNVFAMSMWTLQNNSSIHGIKARLLVDGSPVLPDTAIIALPESGLAYSAARNQFVGNLAAGSHTLGVRLDQPGTIGNFIALYGPQSFISVLALPAGP